MDSRLIEKFFRGACSPEEVAEVLNWFEKEDLDPSQEQEWYRFWQEAADSRQHQDFTLDADSI